VVDADLVLIHGFWSSPATWDRLTAQLSLDPDLAGLRIHGFGYESPRLPRWFFSSTRVPDYDDIAQSLPAYLAAHAPGRTPIVIVTHSQGGLILQRFLAWMLTEGRGRELARIRAIVMLSCPNEGSEYLASIRAVTGFDRHPQAGQLDVLEREVGEARRVVLRQIVNASTLDDRHCPIPVYVYSGRTDNIVVRQSAQSAFPYAEVLPGDHFSILVPDSPGSLTLPTLRRHILNAITDATSITIPTAPVSGTPAAAEPGQHGQAAQSPERAMGSPAIDKNSGTVLNATNSIVNLYESQAPKSVRESSPQSSSRGVRDSVEPDLIWNAPPRLANFVGREDLIRQLRSNLSSTKSQNICSIYGLGGIGKTGLAVEYAHRYADDYKLVWWIHADEPNSISQQLARLAMRLRLPQSTDSERSVAALEYLRHHSNWLLVFDNAENERDISSLIPSGNGHVVITTRKTTFGSLGKTISIDVLKREESVTFLARRIAGVNKDKCSQLAEVLGDLPLALEQAAAYLDTTRMPLGTYLSLWKTRSEELLARGQVVGHDHTIATVWDLSVERVAREQPAALDLLKISAFLAPNIIPAFLFAWGAGELPEPLASAASDPLSLADVTGALTSYSLCQLLSHETIVALTFHRLVQAAMRRKLSEQEKESVTGTTLRLLMHDAPSDIVLTPDDWPWWYVFMQHVLTAANHGEKYPSNEGNVAWLLSRAARYFDAHGQPSEGIPLFEHALALAESFYGENTWNVAMILDDLSKALASVGEFKKARDTMERAQRIAESLPDDGSARSAKFKVDLAMLLRDMGRSKESRRLLKEYLQEYDKGDNDNSPTLISALATLSVTLFDLGEYDEAIIATERVIAMVAQGGGDHDLHTASILNNLGALLLRQDKKEKALECFSQSLTIHQEIYGPRHPVVAVQLNNLAAVMREQGDLVTAKELIERALSINEDTLGSKSAATLATLINLGAIVRALGDIESAETIYRTSLRDMESIHGPNHPDVGKAASNLAVMLSQADRPEEARPLALRAAVIAESSFGYHHMELAMRLISLGTIQYQLGQVREARKTYRRAVAIAKKERNKDDPRAIQLIRNFDDVG
jgi:tetratricopeptide (TPR) repeat protein/pimeloyl-ACP methyl ester carboxylesterase